MILSRNQLVTVMPGAAAVAYQFLEPLNRALVAYEVDQPLEVAAFLATLAEETTELTRMTENLNYSAARMVEIWPSRFPTLDDAAPYAHKPEALGNRVYSGRYGNGDEASGDGYKYRGRGMGITFKDNYAKIGHLMDLDLVKSPELLEQPLYAMFSGAALWWSEDISADANRADFRRVTKDWAGALTNYDQRLIYYQRACKVLGI